MSRPRFLSPASSRCGAHRAPSSRTGPSSAQRFPCVTAKDVKHTGHNRSGRSRRPLNPWHSGMYRSRWHRFHSFLGTRSLLPRRQEREELGRRAPWPGPDLSRRARFQNFERTSRFIASARHSSPRFLPLGLDTTPFRPSVASKPNANLIHQSLACRRSTSGSASVERALPSLARWAALDEAAALPDETLLAALQTELRPWRIGCATLPLTVLRGGIALFRREPPS